MKKDKSYHRLFIIGIAIMVAIICVQFCRKCYFFDVEHYFADFIEEKGIKADELVIGIGGSEDFIAPGDRLPDLIRGLDSFEVRHFPRLDLLEKLGIFEPRGSKYPWFTGDGDYEAPHVMFAYVELRHEGQLVAEMRLDNYWFSISCEGDSVGVPLQYGYFADDVLAVCIASVS